MYELVAQFVEGVLIQGNALPICFHGKAGMKGFREPHNKLAAELIRLYQEEAHTKIYG